MSKKKSRCPRLYLLNDEDLLEILCCGSNLESFAENVGRVFNNIKCLKVDVNIPSEKRILGCYGRNNEYFAFKTVILYLSWSNFI